MIRSILLPHCFDRFGQGPDPGLWQSFEWQIKRKAKGDCSRTAELQVNEYTVFIG